MMFKTKVFDHTAGHAARVAASAMNIYTDLITSYRGHKTTCFWPGHRDKRKHDFLMSGFESVVLLTCPWTVGGYLSESSEKMQTTCSPRLGPSCV